MARDAKAIRRKQCIDSFDPYRQTDQKIFRSLTYGTRPCAAKGASVEIELVRHPDDPQWRKNKPA
ncbi:hypothetical protein CKA34_15265 [Rhizobium sp. 11515TR]|nr:hypothetical protein CKA34_15265 [Rhizobium sp. 11515TR]